MKAKVIILILVGLVLSVAAANAHSVRITFGWNANSESDLAGYKLYSSSTSGGPYQFVAQFGLVTTGQVTLDVQEGVPMYFVLSAFDVENNESGFSNQVGYTLSDDSPGYPPAAPAVLSIISTLLLN